MFMFNAPCADHTIGITVTEFADPAPTDQRLNITLVSRAGKPLLSRHTLIVDETLYGILYWPSLWALYLWHPAYWLNRNLKLHFEFQRLAGMAPPPDKDQAPLPGGFF